MVLGGEMGVGSGDETMVNEAELKPRQWPL
jgi:hypothetical protein